MRSVAMVLALSAAYVLLRGHPENWPAVVRACLAVLTLVAGIGAWGKRERGRGDVVPSRRGAGWTDYLAIGAAVLAVECLFLVFFSTVPDPLENAAAKVETWLRPERAAARKEDAGRQRNRRQGNWLWNEEQRRPLPKRTNLRQGNRPEIFLQPSSESDASRMIESRLYVQAFALSRYDDAAWQAHPGERETRLAENDGWLRLSSGRRGEPVACRVFHGGETKGGNPLTGLQGLTAARVGSVVSRDAGLHLLPEKEDGFGYEYDTLSKPWLLDDLEGEDLQLPDQVDGVLLERPGGSLGQQIERRAGVVAGDGALFERLSRIRNHLRTTMEYSLVTENADDRDPLENFMFFEQRGHCEFYATAGAMLARAAGVPSRIGYGWVGGTYYEGSRLFVFRAREAHAWTEVLLKGYGWVVLDPTPPSSLARARTEVAPEGEKPPGSDELAREELDVAGDHPVWKIGLGLALFFGLPGVMMLLWRASRIGSRGGTGGDLSRGQEPGGYLDDFLIRCGKYGLRVAPGDTLRTLLADLEESPEFAEDLLRYHYAVSYEGMARDRAEEKRLKRRVAQWG